MNLKGLLLCSHCGAKARATCRCDAPYVSAGVLAAEYVRQHPEMSNVAIGKALGIGVETVRRAREPTSPNEEVIVEKRIGLDGKVRRMPTSRHVNPMPDELVHLPAAAELLEGIEPLMAEIKKEAAIRATVMSPDRIASLVRDLLNKIFTSSWAPLAKAEACKNCASKWPTDRKPTKKEIDAVTAVVDAWSALREKILAAGAEEETTFLRAAE
jgi:hypothetical protein